MSEHTGSENARKISTAMWIIGALLLLWGGLGVALSEDAPGAAYLVAVVGAMALIGGLVIRALRD